MQSLVRLTAITLIPLLAACGDAQPAPKANPLQISTITVGQEAPAEAIEAAGTAALRREIPLGFTTPGQIARITVQEGAGNARHDQRRCIAGSSRCRA